MFGKREKYTGEDALDKVLEIMYNELSGKVSEDQLKAVENTLIDVKQQRADIDYIAYMSGITLDNKDDLVKIESYYKSGLWDSRRVSDMVEKHVITQYQYDVMIGK